MKKRSIRLLIQNLLSNIYRGCQKNVPVFKRFFLQPLMPHFRIWVFLNRVLCTRLHPHRLRHWRAFVFFRHKRKKQATRFAAGR
jgi:hypothetical protein